MTEILERAKTPKDQTMIFIINHKNIFILHLKINVTKTRTNAKI